MEICHGLVGILSDTAGQVTSQSASTAGGQCGPSCDLRADGENYTNSDSILCTQKILGVFSQWNPIYIKPYNFLSHWREQIHVKSLKGAIWALNSDGAFEVKRCIYQEK